MAWAQGPEAPSRLLEMSSMSLLQCLCCNHLNPAGAAFCNECGSPLDLQPCAQCGAIDTRSATNCRKCGAEFPRPEDPAHAPPDPHEAAVALSSTNEAPATRSRRRWPLVLSASLLMVVTGWFYYSRQGPEPLTPGVSGRPTAGAAAPSTGATPIDTGPMPAGTMASTEGLDKAPAPSAPGAATGRPSPAAPGEVKTRREPPIRKECPEAVAALGLCSPTAKQGKP